MAEIVIIFSCLPFQKRIILDFLNFYFFYYQSPIFLMYFEMLKAYAIN